MNTPQLPRPLTTFLQALITLILTTLILTTLILTTPATASEPTTVEGILEKMDSQMTFGTRSSLSRMIITADGESREKQFRTFARGQEDAFIIFDQPRRDAGTKFLKIEGQLWIYFPRTEKTVKVSGHLMRQSMLGSDFSYEDMTENRKMLDDYNGTLLEEEEIDGEPCFVLHLKEKNPGMSYPERKYWISKKYYLPVREERYAKTGKLLKVARFEGIHEFEDRRYPAKIIMEDSLKDGSRTEIVFDEMNFKIDEPEGIFDRRNLRRDVRF